MIESAATRCRRHRRRISLAPLRLTRPRSAPAPLEARAAGLSTLHPPPLRARAARGACPPGLPLAGATRTYRPWWCQRVNRTDHSSSMESTTPPLPHHHPRHLAGRVTDGDDTAATTSCCRSQPPRRAKGMTMLQPRCSSSVAPRPPRRQRIGRCGERHVRHYL